MPAPPPDWLCEIGKIEWQRVYRADLDETLLGAYCQQYGRWREAEAVLEAHGLEVVLRNDKGEVRAVMPSPQVGISTKAFDRMLKAAAAIGLTANLKAPGEALRGRRDGDGDGDGFFASVQ